MDVDTRHVKTCPDCGAEHETKTIETCPACMLTAARRLWVTVFKMPGIPGVDF
jgi:NMD protein affecting ribosome stability and mRNA decay